VISPSIRRAVWHPPSGPALRGNLPAQGNAGTLPDESRELSLHDFQEVRWAMAECVRMGVDQERDRTTERQVASRGAYRTERLRLVPINASHASKLWELHQDEGIVRWFLMNREQALRFAERMESSWSRGVGKWLAYEESTGAFIGRGGPSWATLEGVEYVEIGWALRKEFWGRGYATEIRRAGLDHAFSVQGVEQVVSFTEIHNARSRAVMERLGMRYVRQILRPGLIAGSATVHEEAPFALYRITRADP
jgi:RimJ/RimL family protein N-acetyltransferase